MSFKEQINDCSALFNCCRCGGVDCGCRYCFDCNACENCQNETGECENLNLND